MNEELWRKCLLSGTELDTAVARLLQMPDGAYSTDWAIGGPLIDSQQIFLDPPTQVHLHGQGWVYFPYWKATVSSVVRTYRIDPDPLNKGAVGRGMGQDPLIATMRAIVASFGPGA